MTIKSSYLAENPGKLCPEIDVRHQKVGRKSLFVLTDGVRVVKCEENVQGSSKIV